MITVVPSFLPLKSVKLSTAVTPHEHLCKASLLLGAVHPAQSMGALTLLGVLP